MFNVDEKVGCVILLVTFNPDEYVVLVLEPLLYKPVSHKRAPSEFPELYHLKWATVEPSDKANSPLLAIVEDTLTLVVLDVLTL